MTVAAPRAFSSSRKMARTRQMMCRWTSLMHPLLKQRKPLRRNLHLRQLLHHR